MKQYIVTIIVSAFALALVACAPLRRAYILQQPRLAQEDDGYALTTMAGRDSVNVAFRLTNAGTNKYRFSISVDNRAGHPVAIFHGVPTVIDEWGEASLVAMNGDTQGWDTAKVFLAAAMRKDSLVFTYASAKGKEQPGWSRQVRVSVRWVLPLSDGRPLLDLTFERP
ncbi:MAG: hypothetical protein HY851_09365 [candidate division Zixibacteria bacterium]|nr:hypothetical protein [candidate division Zixibacteria bacterium]